MELTLARQNGSQVLVTCDNQPSHTFDLLTLLPHEKGLPQPFDDPVAYGQTLYAALFPPASLAQRALANAPERILLIATDNDLDAVPWEYAYGPDGFLVLDCHFVRGLPADQRIPAPTLDTGLHIVAIPSNPLSHELEPLNIEGEWMRLKEIIQNVPYAITLERTRPPTIEQVRTLVANQRHRVIHFMGHGGQDETGAILYFEQDNGDLDPVTAKQFVQRVRGTVFLVTLNACVSATPGPTAFSNLAAALVRQKMPYALGMRLSIIDDDARAFSRAFYSELAHGSSIEEALFQARLTLGRSSCRWAVGVPVLYTALARPATGFASIAGTPLIKEHQPRIEVSALPRAEGTFQGRIDELKALGTALTGDSRPPIITIHGGGGQGKTALAREVVERFAHAWPTGVWATSLENLPNREVFVIDLARFLGIDTEKVTDPRAVERVVLAQLTGHRILIVLDNAETLIDAVEARNAEALSLVQFIQQLPGPSVSLLVTSRVQLGWPGEVTYELGGLSPEEGALLFRQSAPQRANEIELTLAKELSYKLEGHPFGLRLLAGSFNASAISLQALIQEWDKQLVQAENKYVGEEHRHRRLYACIEISLRSLDAHSRSLLSGLWVFHAPFLTETAVAIFDSGHEKTESTSSPIRDHLHTLWLRSLLERKMITVRDGMLHFYYLLPTTRLYVEHYLEQTYDRQTLTARFGTAYAQMTRFVQHELNKSATAVALAQQAREDFERGSRCITGIERSIFLRHWGWVVYRLGDPRYGLTLLEQALEIVQGKDQSLELEILHNMAEVYQVTGKPQAALRLLQAALPIRREMGDRAGEAAILNNMAEVYRFTGQPLEALNLYREALSLLQEAGNRAGEASVLNNIAGVYRVTGKPQEALNLYQAALLLMREGGDRAGEAWTLIGMAVVYQTIGQPMKALSLYQEILPLMREVDNRAGEATALSNMAILYRILGRPIEALHIYQEALQIHREVGYRSGEVATLNNIAQLLQQMQCYAEALKAFEQSVALGQLLFHPASEAAGLVGMALLLYQHLKRPEGAISYMEQAIAVLMQTDLSQDAAGRTIEKLQDMLQAMHAGASL